MAEAAHAFHGPHLIRDALSRNWWLLLLRGICAILFGVFAFAWPGVTLLSLVLVFGAYALADGILALAAAVAGGAPAPRWWLAVAGLSGIAFGILTFFWPGMTALLLVSFIAAWSIVTGVMQVVGAIRLRRAIDNEVLLITSGVLSVALGVVLIAWPGLGAVAVLLVIGAYAVLYGVLLVSLALRLRRLGLAG